MPARLLIVEDSATEALRTRLILEREGYQISLATDGKEGLVKATEEQPDLIILDTIMPRMSGYEAWEKLKNDPKTASIPVILMTTEPGPTSLTPAQGLGSDNFVSKPYTPAVLSERVRRVIAAQCDPLAGEGQAGLGRMLGALGVARAVVQGGRIITADACAEELLGEKIGQLKGQPFAECVRSDDMALAQLIDDPARADSDHNEFRVQINGTNHERWLRVHAQPTKANGQQATQVACLDITEHKRAADELRRARQELDQAHAKLEAAQGVKTEFLSKMSHELRTPLHEIMGMVELVLGTELGAEQRDYLERARTSANALLAAVSDMLEYSELMGGQVTLDEKRFDLWQSIQQTVEMMKAQAEEKGLRLSCTISPQAPRELIGDARRLNQVLLKIIENAIKFTAQGWVEVQVQEAKLQPTEVELHVMVRDTGIGIAPDKLETIFGMFQQSDNSPTRRYGGVGLGLTVAKRLAELLGGRIWAESQVGRGSTFHYTARLKRRPEKALSGGAQPRHPLHILLAEDSPTNQLLAVANLKKAGHTVEVAKNGLQAVQAVERGEFDLILMDIAMPEMDGLEATQRIRAKEVASGRRIPIIAMTAFALNEYREKCLEAGMDGFVTKPVSADELHRTIEPFLTQAEDGSAGEEQIPPVNLATALEMAGGDLELLAAVVEVSLAECPGLMARLKDAVARGDAGELEHAAHTLKGTVANVGSGPARELAQKLESMGTHGNLADAAAALRQLEPEMERFVAFFAQPDWQQAAPVLEEGCDG